MPVNFSCYVIDDEPDAIAIMKEYIEMTPGLTLVGHSQNPLEALPNLTGENAPDITFIDVDMRQLSGLELAEMVNLYTTVVFTTAFPQYALEAFDREAFDFLLKPINYERFAKCIQRARRKITRPGRWLQAIRDDFFTIKSEVKGRLVKIRYEEVIYMEGSANYIHIYTTEGKHTTYLTIKEIERHLPTSLFARIHRSFIVNVNFVKVIERAQIRLQDGERIMMGDHYKQAFLARMDSKLIKTDRSA